MTVKTINSAIPSQNVLVDRFRRKYWELNAHSVRGSASGGLQNVRRLPFSSVIVPLDGARYAEHALPFALELAAALESPLLLESADFMGAHSFDPWSLSFEEAASPQRPDRMHTYLKELADRISTDSVPVTSPLRKAPIPARSLIETAGVSNLVVMARRPCRFTDPFSLGHSVERLLKFGSSPLISVRGNRWPYTLREAKKTRHILVVLDGTAEAEYVLPAAVAIAGAVEAKLTLLRIVPSMPYYGIPSAEKEIEAKAYLETVVQAVQQRRVEVDAAVWSSNEALGQVILSYANDCNADLIALTTSLRRTLVGSFRRQPVRYLVRKSRTPLLIVSSDKATSHRDQPARPQGTT
jgi:nucleotide-binding universal stress UspA family protein